MERKILRRKFGPVKDENGMWRIRTNNELNKLIKNRTILNMDSTINKLFWP